jgi:hypothetical protein
MSLGVVLFVAASLIIAIIAIWYSKRSGLKEFHQVEESAGAGPQKKG